MSALRSVMSVLAPVVIALLWLRPTGSAGGQDVRILVLLAERSGPRDSHAELGARSVRRRIRVISASVRLLQNAIAQEFFDESLARCGQADERLRSEHRRRSNHVSEGIRYIRGRAEPENHRRNVACVWRYVVDRWIHLAQQLAKLR